MSSPAFDQRQEAVIGFLRRYQTEIGHPPSIREIGDACALPSTSVVKYHLDALEKAGRVRRPAGLARCIEIIDAAPSARDRAAQLVLDFLRLDLVPGLERGDLYGEPRRLVLARAKELLADAEAAGWTEASHG